MSEILSSDALRAQAEALNIKPKHYELALAEQAMRRANGRTMSIAEILHRNGFASGERNKTKGKKSEDITMQALRLYVPSAVQAAMGLCLLELRKGILRIAVGDRVDDADLLRITEALGRANHKVESVDVEPWDRAELARLMREQSEMAGERLLSAFWRRCRAIPTTRCWSNRRCMIFLPKPAKPHVGYSFVVAGRRRALLDTLSRRRRSCL